MNAIDYFRQKSRERETAIDDYNGQFERWAEIFPHDANSAIVWADLPAKRAQAESDLVECEKAIKKYGPIIRGHMRVDLRELPYEVEIKPILDRFEDARRFFDAPAAVRGAMRELDNLDIRYLATLDFFNRSPECRCRMLRRSDSFARDR